MKKHLGFSIGFFLLVKSSPRRVFLLMKIITPAPRTMSRATRMPTVRVPLSAQKHIIGCLRDKSLVALKMTARLYLSPSRQTCLSIFNVCSLKFPANFVHSKVSLKLLTPVFPTTKLWLPAERNIVLGTICH